MTRPAALRRRRDELVLRVQRADDTAAVFAEASTRLRRLVPFDAAVWLSTDPGTGLPTAPTRVEGFDLGHPDTCSEFWRRELLFEDVNLYRDVARARVPVAALRATARDPRASGRYRRFLRPHGFDDELRAVPSPCCAARAGPPSPTPRPAWWRACPRRWARRSGSAPARPSRWGVVRHDRPGLLLFDEQDRVLLLRADIGDGTVWITPAACWSR